MRRWQRLWKRKIPNAREARATTWSISFDLISTQLTFLLVFSRSGDTLAAADSGTDPFVLADAALASPSPAGDDRLLRLAGIYGLCRNGRARGGDGGDAGVSCKPGLRAREICRRWADGHLRRSRCAAAYQNSPAIGGANATSSGSASG